MNPNDILNFFWDGTITAQAKPYHFIKLASYVFPSLGEHSLQCWDTLEFHYVEVVAQSAEIIFSSSKAAQSQAFGWALINSFLSSSAVHWREGLMVNGGGDDYWQFFEVLYATLISKMINTQDHSTASYTYTKFQKRRWSCVEGIKLRLQWLLPRLPMQSQESNLGPVIFKFEMYSKIVY